MNEYGSWCCKLIFTVVYFINNAKTILTVFGSIWNRSISYIFWICARSNGHVIYILGNISNLFNHVLPLFSARTIEVFRCADLETAEMTAEKAHSPSVLLTSCIEAISCCVDCLKRSTKRNIIFEKALLKL